MGMATSRRPELGTRVSVLILFQLRACQQQIRVGSDSKRHQQSAALSNGAFVRSLVTYGGLEDESHFRDSSIFGSNAES
jgi:hypothetical protein